MKKGKIKVCLRLFWKEGRTQASKKNKNNNKQIHRYITTLY